jgi:hypothetical protein
LILRGQQLLLYERRWVYDRGRVRVEVDVDEIADERSWLRSRRLLLSRFGGGSFDGRHELVEDGRKWRLGDFGRIGRCKVDELCRRWRWRPSNESGDFWRKGRVEDEGFVGRIEFEERSSFSRFWTRRLGWARPRRGRLLL